MCEFRLYLVGRTPKSVEVVKGVIRLLEDAADGNYNLKVIDVIQSPELTVKDNILATPVLEKVSPEPVRKIIGDLSDKERILFALGLTVQQEEVKK